MKNNHFNYRYLILSICFFYLISGCKKEQIDTQESVSFSGALDSVSMYRTDDSINNYGEFTIIRNYFDKQRRVKKMFYSNFGEGMFHLFYYQGDEMLPYKMIDSMPSSPDYATIYDHQLIYNNSQLVFDSVNYYERYFYNQVILPKKIYSISYKYAQNYRAKRNTEYNVCQNVDTVFFNNLGDISSLSRNCGERYIQNVDAYTNDKNPFSELNTYPLFDNLTNAWFWIGIQNLDFNIFQPKRMFKKLSGENRVYYRQGKDDMNELNFYTEKDAAGRIIRILIANSTYSYNGGIRYLSDKFFSGYKFYYHQ